MSIGEEERGSMDTGIREQDIAGWGK